MGEGPPFSPETVDDIKSIYEAFDSKAYIPESEFRFKPYEKITLGFKYAFTDFRSSDIEKGSKSHRVLIWAENSFFKDKLKLRARYRGENRNYDYPSKQRKSSFKHSISFSAYLDIN